MTESILLVMLIGTGLALTFWAIYTLVLAYLKGKARRR